MRKTADDIKKGYKPLVYTVSQYSNQATHDGDYLTNDPFMQRIMVVGKVVLFEVRCFEECF